MLRPAANRSTRVGGAFQLSIPEFERSKAPPREDRVGQLMWAPDRVSEEKLSAYLRYVRGLFGDRPALYSEERALYLLKQCDYDCDKARELLKPSPIEELADPEEPLPEGEYEGDDFCMVCVYGGDLVLCDFQGCKKVYHPTCAGLEEVPEGTWHCPRHVCSVEGCSNPPEPDQMCVQCTTVYCRDHLPSKVKKLLRTCRDRDFGEFMCMGCIDKELKEHVAKGGKKSGPRGMIFKNAFYERTAKLLKRQNKGYAEPVVGGKKLDVFKIYKEVIKRGGIRNVVDNTGWGGIIKELGVPTNTKASDLLLAHYIYTLYTYERLYFAGFKPLEKLPDPEKLHALLAEGTESAESPQPTRKRKRDKKGSSGRGRGSAESKRSEKGKKR